MLCGTKLDVQWEEAFAKRFAGGSAKSRARPTPHGFSQLLVLQLEMHQNACLARRYAATIGIHGDRSATGDPNATLSKSLASWPVLYGDESAPAGDTRWVADC